MYKEKFCKYKNRAVVLNEFNMDCICVHCGQKNCNAMKVSGIMNNCQERIVINFNVDYRMAKSYMCRMCARMTRNIIKNSAPSMIIRANGTNTR